MRESTTMPSSASRENQAREDWPWGTMISAASKGPREVPRLPPTWKSACAKPRRPPDAMKAMREASGWKTAEPSPTTAAEHRIQVKLSARERETSPSSVSPMPTANE